MMKELPNILVLSGVEQYKKDCYRRMAESVIDEAMKAFNLSKYEGAFNGEILSACNMAPMLANKRVVELYAPDIKALDTQEFVAYCKAPCPSTTLVVILKGQADKRFSVTKNLTKSGFLITCDRAKDEAELQRIILSEVVKGGGKISVSAMEEFTRRLSYFEAEDVSLLAVAGYVKSLVSYADGEITEDAVKAIVPENTAADVFSLASLLKAGDMHSLLKQSYLIPADEAIGAASALLRELRLSYKGKFFSMKETGAFKPPVFSNESEEKLADAIKFVTDSIRDVKRGLIRSENLLQSIFNRLFTIFSVKSGAA